jgi:hypothetical protein
MSRYRMAGALGAMALLGVFVGCGGGVDSASGVSCKADDVCQTACAHDPDCTQGGAGAEENSHGGSDGDATAGSAGGPEEGDTGGRTTGGSAGSANSHTGGHTTGGSAGSANSHTGGRATGGSAGSANGDTGGLTTGGSAGAPEGGTSGGIGGDTSGGGEAGTETGPQTAPECQTWVDQDLLANQELEAELDAMPLVWCSTETVASAEGPEEPAKLPDGLPAGQYVLVARALGESSIVLIYSNQLTGSATIEAGWPSALPDPSNTGCAEASDSCHVVTSSRYVCDSHGAQASVNVESYAPSYDLTFLLYFYRPMTSEQCERDKLPGESCVWDFNCQAGLYCTEFRCTA